MQVNSLKISSFRNLKSGQLQFSNAVNVFNGKNGSGKTNILEAVFVMLLGRSQRGAADSVMLREGDDFYRLEGDATADDKKYSVAVAYQKGGRKKITIEQVAVRASELFSRHTVVSSAPEDITILSGAPAGRRDFINLYLSQASPTYIAVLTDFQKALVQKNAFLKQEDNSAETPYDDLLVDYGSAVIMARYRFIEIILPIAERYYEKISSGGKFKIKYNPSVPLADENVTPDQVKSAYKKKLARYRDRERILQTALVGPHRDEIDFYIRGFPARAYGSQGELRTATIALKMAVFEYLKSVRRETPILLLDEIFAELDERRKEMLVESFGDFGQLFLTSATALPDSLAQNSRRFEIEAGKIINE